jgi:hypothetical protein
MRSGKRLGWQWANERRISLRAEMRGATPWFYDAAGAARAQIARALVFDLWQIEVASSRIYFDSESSGEQDNLRCGYLKREFQHESARARPSTEDVEVFS